MQTYRVCKIAEDWRQQQSSALVKRQQQRSTTSLLSPVSRIASMLQRSGIKTANSIHLYRGLPTSGRAKMGVTAYYSYIHVCTKSIYIYIYAVDGISGSATVELLRHACAVQPCSAPAAALSV